MFIKTILKKIFPVVFLKKTFLLYNRLRIRTIDRIIFPEFKFARSEFQFYREAYPFRENNVSLEGINDQDVLSYMNRWYDWTQLEYLVTVEHQCYIEPEHGWAIVPPNRLIYWSLGLSRTEFQKKPRFIKFLRKQKIISVSKAISLRDTGEENYFHFFNDVLAKIFFLQSNGISFEGARIIVSKKLWDKPYFQFYLQRSGQFMSLPWIVQDDEYIKCDSAVFCKPLTHRIDIWQPMIRPLNSTRSGQRKIFLTRARNRLRFLENDLEIINICKQHGLEIVDADDLTNDQQIELFSNCRLIAGIHGAGLTNMVFRKAPCAVLEIFPPPDLGYLPFHYIMLAKMQGFEYQAVIGTTPEKKYSGGFYLDPAKFDQALRQFAV